MAADLEIFDPVSIEAPEPKDLAVGEIANVPSKGSNTEIIHHVIVHVHTCGGLVAVDITSPIIKVEFTIKETSNGKVHGKVVAGDVPGKVVHDPNPISVIIESDIARAHNSDFHPGGHGHAVEAGRNTSGGTSSTVEDGKIVITERRSVFA